MLHTVVSGLSRVDDIELRVAGDALRISAVVEERIDVAVDAKAVRASRTGISAIEIAVMFAKLSELL